MMKRILLVLVLTTLIFACKKESNFTTTMPSGVEGCMDSLATNHDPEATIDDGSCEYAAVEGCMDPLATNYNAAATVDDGSCEYPPSALKLSSITINLMPMTNNGSDWDMGVGVGGFENPDVFYVLKQGGGDIASSSSQDNISDFPISFTEGLPYTINNLSQEYTIYLYDSDVGGEELIGSCSFTPSAYIPITGGSTTNGIDIQSGGINMTLAIEWLP